MSQQGSQPSYRLGLAGCGKMGSAMAKAWLQSGIVKTLDILDPSPSSDLQRNSSVKVFQTTQDFIQNAQAWDILVLAVKPQIMMDVCQSLKAGLPSKLACLSIAAGIPINSLTSALDHHQPIIRAMPNTPAAIGCGVTVAMANETISSDQKSLAQLLLEKLGRIEWIEDEALFDAVTALSGSGPAYVFLLIELMAQAGIKAGLQPEFAQNLARETVIGSAALAQSQPDLSAAILRENVTSPNGTTAAALSILMDGRMETLMAEAIQKAADRSRELSQ